MRRYIPAGVLIALVFLIPAAPAVAQTGSPGLNEACQTVERKVYKDLRGIVTIDLDTAPAVEVRVLAARILDEAIRNSLPVLNKAMQERLNGTDADLRAFLKTNLQAAWITDLRITIARTLVGAGANVNSAAQKVLADGTVSGYLTYLNNDLYAARERDCASASPSASASTSPSPSVSASASVALSSSAAAAAAAAAAGSLPTTGANTSILALGAAALILFGTGAVLVARRLRT